MRIATSGSGRCLESVTSVFTLIPKDAIDLVPLDTLYIDLDFLLVDPMSMAGVRFRNTVDSDYNRRVVHVSTCGKVLYCHWHKNVIDSSHCIDGFDDNEWHHLTVSFKKKRLQCYVDGKEMLNVPRCDFTPEGFALSSFVSARFHNIVLSTSRIGESTSIETPGVCFEFGKDKVQEKYMPLIRKLADSLKKNPTLKLKVGGYADDSGSSGYNMALSKRRAQAVKKILVSYCIADNRIISEGLGSLALPTSGDRSAERAKHRKVELKIVR